MCARKVGGSHCPVHTRTFFVQQGARDAMHTCAWGTWSHVSTCLHADTPVATDAGVDTGPGPRLETKGSVSVEPRGWSWLTHLIPGWPVSLTHWPGGQSPKVEGP